MGFVAPGLAYARSFVRAAGHGENVAVVGAYGHLLTRDNGRWGASTLFAADTAFTAAGQFVTTRGASTGLFFRERSHEWQIYPLTLSGGVDRVWASNDGDVFAGGALRGVLHRFADGTLELLPSEVSGIVDFHGGGSVLYSLAETSLWRYDLGDATSSTVSRAAVLDETLLQIAPLTESMWGLSAASNFEPLDCVDVALSSAGAPVWQGELTLDPPVARYGGCAGGAQRPFSETAFGFTAPTAGTYRIALDVPGAANVSDTGPLRLALRNGCEGWVIWERGFSATARGVDIGLEAGQVLLIEVFSSEALAAPVPFELSIY
jgi:hypothetical protein